MKNLFWIIVVLLIFSISFNLLKSNKGYSISARGCCSSHGGVCGCQNGRTKCCDGTLSPSCQCFKDDVKGLDI